MFDFDGANIGLVLLFSLSFSSLCFSVSLVSDGHKILVFRVL